MPATKAGLLRDTEIATTQVNADNYRALYQIGWIAAIFSVLLGVLEIALTMLPNGTSDNISGIKDWFQLLQDDTFMGLRNLGLVNVGLVMAGVMLYIALYVVLRRFNSSWALVGLVMYLMGSAIFFATNRAFPLLDLSNQYALASSASQRAALEAAGQALLSVGQSHTPGTFLAFFISGAAGIAMSIAMLSSAEFSKMVAWIGIVGSTGLIVYEISNDFMIGVSGSVMGIATVGGILTLTWQVIVAWKLYKLSTSTV